MLDFNKLAPAKAIAILRFCEKYNVPQTEVSKLIELVGQRGPGRPSVETGRPERPKVKEESKGKIKLPWDYKKLRVAKGVTQLVAAEQSGVSLNTLRSVEQRREKPQQSTLDKLNVYYGVLDQENP